MPRFVFRLTVLPMAQVEVFESRDLRSGIALTYLPNSGPLSAWMVASDVVQRVHEVRKSLRYLSTAAVATRLDRHDDGLRLEWTTVPYEYVAAVHKWPELACGLLAPLSARIHVQVAQGWVMTRRSQYVNTEPGLWQPAIAEGLDHGDLQGERFDVSLCAVRGMAEELGVTCVPEQFSLGAVVATRSGQRGSLLGVCVQVVCDLTSWSLDEVRESALRAPDAWEHDAIAVFDDEVCVPRCDSMWMPAILPSGC